MTRALRIAIIVPPTSWYEGSLIDGIISYSRENGPWRLVLQAEASGNRVEPWLREWKPDGVLVGIKTARMARQLGQLRVPIIDLLEESGPPRIPRIVCDDQETMRRAVDHLFDRRFRNFGYVGHSGYFFSRRRRQCFRDFVALRRRGLRGSTPKITSADILLPWESAAHVQQELVDWLHNLPKPVGIVACNDAWAAHVVRVCNECDIRVPDEVAVMGIDDDPAICQLSTPAISSIGVNAHVIGYMAAALLDGMITRGESPAPVTYVAPGLVQARASTATVAISDVKVATIVRYLRDNACKRTSPGAAAKAIGMSRRTLERLMMHHIGHSPAVEIMNARLERVRDLLVGSDLPLAEIARRTGFFHVKTLQRVFRKWNGIAPGEYRRKSGPRPPCLNLSESICGYDALARTKLRDQRRVSGRQSI